jgi:phage terminase large subunit-like protein
MSNLIVDFIDQHIYRNELGQPFCLFPHQREILALAFAFDVDGKLPWDTILYSCPKKSGKTTINGAVTTAWAFTQEAPNECLLLANDAEQASSRVFRTVTGLLTHNPDLTDSAEVTNQRCLLSNGTMIPWLSCDVAGSAGSNHGFTSWDELWGYTSESSRRLWEELTPVPTRRNSIRFITTYAGWENESHLLHELYKLGVGPEEHPDGQGTRLHPDLPVYGNRDARVFVYWDHEPRLPWQTERYYQTQRRTLRPNTYLRLHENRWTVAESRFIDPALWDPNVHADLHPLLPAAEAEIFLGVDASTKHDTAAVVGVARAGERLRLALHRIWKPSPSAPLDLEATIEAYLRQVCQQYRIRRIVCDPYQLHRSITTLKAAGLPIEELPQTTANTVRMGQTLYDLLKGRNLAMYPDADLREQALNTVAVENPSGFRLAKEKASRKIDAIAALSMACVAAVAVPASRPWGFTCDGNTISSDPEPEPVSPMSRSPLADTTAAVLTTTLERLYNVGRKVRDAVTSPSAPPAPVPPPERSLEEIKRMRRQDRSASEIMRLNQHLRPPPPPPRKVEDFESSEIVDCVRQFGVFFPGDQGAPPSTTEWDGWITRRKFQRWK